MSSFVGSGCKKQDLTPDSRGRALDNMRLFLGIELPAAARTAVAAVAGDCRREIERAASRAAIKWVPSENLHITLWFLGDVDDRRAAGLEAVLSAALDTPRFRVGLHGLGAYPPAGRLRVIWVAVAEGRQALGDLYEELARRLAAQGFSPDSRGYSPHLTLARVKDVRGADAAAIRSILDSRRVPVAGFDVPAVTLFRSRTSEAGSQYDSLLRVPLA